MSKMVTLEHAYLEENDFSVSSITMVFDNRRHCSEKDQHVLDRKEAQRRKSFDETQPSIFLCFLLLFVLSGVTCF